MKTSKKGAVTRLVVIAVLAALVVVLQTVASGIRFGPFTITLSLVPIIVGGALYGAGAGALLGAVFGVVVLAAVLSGADFGGQMMLSFNPWATVGLVLLKGIAAGFFSGLICSAFRKSKPILGVVLGSIAAPVCNTGIFTAAMFLFFKPILEQWSAGAGSSSTLSYVVTGLIGLNFLLEFVIGIVLAPVIVKILSAVKFLKIGAVDAKN